MPFRYPSFSLFILFIFLYSSSLLFWQRQYDEGFNSVPSSTVRVDVRSAHGDCQNVSSTKSGISFISTKFKTGWWESFKSNVPTDLSVSPCVTWEYQLTLWNNYKWIEWGTWDSDFFRAKDWETDANGNIYLLSERNSEDVALKQVRKYSSSGVLLLTIGWYGTGDNNLSGTAALFYFPTTLSIDNNGNIFVTDTGNAKVKKYSSTGSWILTIGSTYGDNEFWGTNTQLFTPIRTKGFSDGSIAIVDYFVPAWLWYWKVKVKYFSSTWAYLRTLGSFTSFRNNNLSGTAAELAWVQNLIVQSNGNIVARDALNSSIKIYSSTGNWINTATTGYQFASFWGNSDIFIWKDEWGMLYTIDCARQCVKIYSSTWAFVSQIWDYYADSPVPNNLSGTAAILVTWPELWEYALWIFSWWIYIKTRSCKVNKYTYTWAYILTIWSGSDSNNSCTDNQSSGTWAGLNPQYITTDTGSNLYVYSYNLDPDTFSAINVKIKKYSSTGAWLMDLGSDGPGYDNDDSGTGAGLANSMAFAYNSKLYVSPNDGNIYLGTDRVKVYTSTWAWVTTIGDGTTNGNNLSGRSAGLSYALGKNIIVDNSGSIYVHNGYYFFRKYSSTGAYLFSVGSLGWWYWDNNLSLNSALIDGSNLWAIDSSNNLYLVDYENFKIKKYSFSWMWMMTIGTKTWFNTPDTLSWTWADIIMNVWDFSLNVPNWWSSGFLVKNKIAFTNSWGVYYMFVVGDQVLSYTSTGQFSSVLWTTKNGYLNGSENDSSNTSAVFNNNSYYGNIQLDPYENLWVQTGMKFKKYTSTGTFLFTLGSTTSGDNNLSGTSAQLYYLDTGYNLYTSSTFDNSWSIYINTTYPSKIKKYSSTGAWIFTLGSGSDMDENQLSGTDAEWLRKYSNPYTGIKIDSSQSIYLLANNPWNDSVYDNIGTRIKKYSATGVWMFDLWWKHKFDSVNSGTGIILTNSTYYNYAPIISDYSGNLWIVDIHEFNNDVLFDPYSIRSYKVWLKKYTSTGSYLLKIGSGNQGDNDNSWTGADFYPIVNNFSDIYGNIYPAHGPPSTSNFTIKKYSSTWTWLYSLPVYSDCWTYYYYVNKWGYNYVYSSDCTTGYISKYDPDGNFLFSLDSNTYGSSFVSDDDDNLYAASGASLIRYDSTWAVSLIIGQYDTYWQNNLSATSALLSGINTIAVHEGNIFLSTYSASGRIIMRKYSSTGDFLFELWSSTTAWDNTLSWTGAEWIDLVGFYIDQYWNIIVNDVYNGKLKLYSWIDGTYIWTLWSWLEVENDDSGTWASLGNSSFYPYQPPTRDALFLSSPWVFKIKKYIP